MRALTACVVTVGILGALTGPVRAGEEFNVTVSYVLEPSQEIPEGVRAVAVLDDGVKVEIDGDDARSKKWAKIAADMLEQMILDSKQKFKTDIELIKRRQTGKVMAEKDLKAAGLAEGNGDAKLSDVQALITSELNIQIETKKSKKTTFDVTSLVGGGGRGFGFGGGTIGAREAEAISRNLTLQCKFSMMDAATSKSLFEYAPKPFRKLDKKKPSPVFGRSAGEADLDSADAYIGELVELGTREFVSMFVPVQVEYSYELESSSSKESQAGIRAMRADDFEGARESFLTAIRKRPEDHKSLFALAVTCELMQDYDSALKYYRQAAACPKLDDDELAKYLAAKDRLSAHKDRIRKAKKS
jgi:hypothetical protein